MEIVQVELLTEFEIWMFLAGLGIFLFGMHMMEESIRVLSGGAFKSLIRKYTGTRLRAIFSGIFSTAVLQSSSAVSLMVLAFVGAGIMNLVQAISVMMGTKIGTTATAWIVAVFGFEFNIDSFSLPLIGIGGLGMILLAKSPRYVNISKFLVAFGFLFMGLDYMKSSVDQFSEMIDPSAFAGYGIIVFALAGMVMTAVMQSSSATIAIVLTMLFSGVITFQAGAAMVVGANVGTTVTVILGSIGGVYTKKQAAFSQLIFTVGAAVITLAILPVLTWLVLTGLGFSDNLVLGLALFHTLFNLFGVFLFYPFVDRLASVAEMWIPDRQVELSVYIHKTDPDVPDAALEAFRKEVGWQLVQTLHFLEQIVHPGKSPGAIGYGDLVAYHTEIFEYYTQMHSTGMDEEAARRADELLRASRNIMNTSKNLNDAAMQISVLRREVDDVQKAAFISIKNRLLLMIDKGMMLHKKIEREDLSIAHEDELNRLSAFIENADKEFIKMCRSAVNKPRYKQLEITSLLMMNRTITQSCRMIIFSLKALLAVDEVLEEPESVMSEIEQ